LLSEGAKVQHNLYNEWERDSGQRAVRGCESIT
jgi:hypothetical protein